MQAHRPLPASALPLAAHTLAPLLTLVLLLAGCQRGFEQAYDAAGVPQFDAHSFDGLRAEGPLYPDQRVSTTEGGCRLTTATTDTPQHVFTTRFKDCADAPKQHALVMMRQKADGQESEVMDLTADREPLFEHTLRFADVDGEGPPELVMLSCSGADTPERCEKGWIYRQAPDQPAFINLFAGGYHRLWLNAHYIVTETGSGVVGLPSTPQDMGQPVRRGSFLGPGHLTRQVYLRHPPKRPDALDLPNLPNENTVTWHHGLLFYADLDTATGQCSLHHPSQPDGAIRPLPTVPERLQRFCAVSFRP